MIEYEALACTTKSTTLKHATYTHVSVNGVVTQPGVTLCGWRVTLTGLTRRGQRVLMTLETCVTCQRVDSLTYDRQVAESVR